MGIELLINASSYVLGESRFDEEIELAHLKNGAQALLTDNHIREAHIENAIQIAEDWLMPFAGMLKGEILDVRDVTGRLEVALSTYADTQSAVWTVDAIEQVFLTMLSHVLRHAPADVTDVADIILLRELAHHGQVAGLRIHR